MNANDMRFTTSEREQARTIAAMSLHERLLLHESLLETALALAGPQALERPHPDRGLKPGSKAYRHLGG